jgi:hypothetical protein
MERGRGEGNIQSINKCGGISGGESRAWSRTTEVGATEVER